MKIKLCEWYKTNSQKNTKLIVNFSKINHLVCLLVKKGAYEKKLLSK